MRALRIGQRVELDLFGFEAGGSGALRAVGTIVALEPGAITVRVERGAGPRDMTVSRRRVTELVVWP
jgi:hypothetical protein